MGTRELVCLEEVEAARRCIERVARLTPMIEFSSTTASSRLLLKAENTQLLGSFKIRGAFNAVASLPGPELSRGLVAFSSGNHGRAVAFAAKQLGAAATIVMPTSTPGIKVDAVRALGAVVELVEPQERDSYPLELVRDTGATLVHPFDSRAAIAGHASIGVEILDQAPQVGSVLVPVSGGGLISGIAVAIKTVRPEVAVVGVEPALAGDAAESFRTGRRVRWDESLSYRTLADGLRATALGELPWIHIQQLVDDIVTVTEDQISDTVRQLAVTAKQVVEPSGAVAAAAFLHGRFRPSDGHPVVAVLSGGNIAPELMASLLAQSSPRQDSYRNSVIPTVDSVIPTVDTADDFRS
jgi:threonine dehydratase